MVNIENERGVTPKSSANSHVLFQSPDEAILCFGNNLYIYNMYCNHTLIVLSREALANWLLSFGLMTICIT